MSAAIILVPVLVAFLSVYVTQRRSVKQQRIQRKMFEAQIRFLQVQVKQLENDKRELTSKLVQESSVVLPVIPEPVKPTQPVHSEHLGAALQELTKLRKTESELQRKLDADVQHFQEKDALVQSLQLRIQALEAAYFAEKDRVQTLELKEHRKASGSHL